MQLNYNFKKDPQRQFLSSKAIVENNRPVSGQTTKKQQLIRPRQVNISAEHDKY